MVWSPADLLWSLSKFAPLTVFESICANLFLVLIASLGITPVYNLIKGNQFPTKGKHVYVTGGSVGLGRAVAIELAKQGAHVTIVARKEGPLKETIELMKQAVATRKDKEIVEQRFHWISADVTDREQSVRALDEASAHFGGRVPDIIMVCAGISIPKLFVEASIEEFESQMKLNYFGSLYTVHEATKRMAATGVKGKVVLTASTMGLIGFAGYSGYAPTKFALRGLAESLRNEFLMYGIGVHIYYPGTMFSPGYENENLTKPLITRDIEGTKGLTSEEAAKGLFAGLRKGYFGITTDFDTDFLRISARGVTPMSNIGWDYLLGLVAPFGATSFLWETNHKVKNYGKNMLKKDL
ncbi:3-dehydrosphinganine reductase [Entomortierella chlamydospora]|uniref:3-dehydrosphinganine reductase n=1 Tax=Entomortierella chlamydospora TaxID=101097 RepID=A0A9P6MXN7_9FUNG|nr:3-dehydrosphinganine reductase [Entomortierella chlamydospora]KAG0016153.1 3-dehydrosphinganine reductase [Entomortierella chlamydospora]